MAIRDPLFDKKHAITAASTAAINERTISPISGEPMRMVMCSNIPVMVDLPNRVVVPVFDDANVLQ